MRFQYVGIGTTWFNFLRTSQNTKRAVGDPQVSVPASQLSRGELGTGGSTDGDFIPQGNRAAAIISRCTH